MLWRVWDERIEVESDNVWSSVAVLGEVACFVGRAGDVGIARLGPEGRIVSRPAAGAFGTKTVFRTSRRPRMVPAFRLTPVCWACCKKSQ